MQVKKSQALFFIAPLWHHGISCVAKQGMQLGINSTTTHISAKEQHILPAVWEYMGFSEVASDRLQQDLVVKCSQCHHLASQSWPPCKLSFPFTDCSQVSQYFFTLPPPMRNITIKFSIRCRLKSIWEDKLKVEVFSVLKLKSYYIVMMYAVKIRNICSIYFNGWRYGRGARKQNCASDWETV